MIFRTNFFISIFIILFLTCCSNTEEREEIIGHWHLYINRTAVPNSFYYKLDVLNDSIAVLEDVNYLFNSNKDEIELKRNIIKNENRILLWIEGMYEDFDYALTNDTLFLFSREVKMNTPKYYGLANEKLNCNIELDFFSDAYVSLELPVIEEQLEKITISDFSNVLEVYIGKSKETKEDVVAFGDQYVDFRDLSIEYEKFKVKVPNYHKSQYILILNLDKHVKIDLFDHFLNELNKFEFKHIYQRKITKYGKILLEELDSLLIN